MKESLLVTGQTIAISITHHTEQKRIGSNCVSLPILVYRALYQNHHFSQCSILESRSPSPGHLGPPVPRKSVPATSEHGKVSINRWGSQEAITWAPTRHRLAQAGRGGAVGGGVGGGRQGTSVGGGARGVFGVNDVNTINVYSTHFP